MMESLYRETGYFSRSDSFADSSTSSPNSGNLQVIVCTIIFEGSEMMMKLCMKKSTNTYLLKTEKHIFQRF